jgi:hypothetical protein
MRATADAALPFPESGWQKHSLVHQFLSDVDAILVVHIEYCDGRSANRSSADEHGTVPAEASRPLHSARVK